TRGGSECWHRYVNHFMPAVTCVISSWVRTTSRETTFTSTKPSLVVGEWKTAQTHLENDFKQIRSHRIASRTKSCHGCGHLVESSGLCAQRTDHDHEYPSASPTHNSYRPRWLKRAHHGP